MFLNVTNIHKPTLETLLLLNGVFNGKKTYIFEK